MEEKTLFTNLTPQTQMHLDKSPIQCECFLVKIQKVNSTNILNISKKDPYKQTNHKIQLRGNYVLQIDTLKNQILSGFQCSIDKTFKLIRSHTNDPQQIGEVKGIQFRSQSFTKNNIFLYVPEDNKQQHIKNLSKFAENLGRKYIFQDGFHQIYRAIKKIGKGVTASVYKAIRLTDKMEFAVKSFNKDLYFQMDNGRGKAAFQKQFKTMTQICSDHVSKLVSVYESDNSIYIVMQLLTRSLFSHLRINGIVEGQKTRLLMKNLLLGLEHIHSKNIMHRDLKLENIMVLDNNGQIQPKIIDFGLAENSHNLDFLYLKCGTPGYVAPQILTLNSKDHPKPAYSQKCDIFSMGVIFYILSSGKVLFQGKDQKQVIKKNKQCQIDFEFKNESRLTEHMKNLLRLMLLKDPKLRPPAEQLLRHSFFE